jgi:hypothetical protein
MDTMDDTSSENRRKEKRTAFDDNVYVVIDTEPEMMGQMIEISSTGMAFTFVDMEAASQRLNGREYLHLDLFAAGRGYFLRNLPARVVSNTSTCSKNAQPPLPIKRIGVEFVRPSVTQQMQINALVRSRSASS